MIFLTKNIEEVLVQFNNIIINFEKANLTYENIYDELSNSSEAIKSLRNRMNPFIIKNEKDLLVFISYYHSKFLKNDNNIFLLSILFVLFLINFNINSLELIKNFLDNFYGDKKELESFIDSSDTRGLLFYLCKIYKEDYDELNSNIKYVYFEPKIDKNWMKKYYKIGRAIVFWFYKNYLGDGLFVVLYTPKCRYKLEKGGCASCSLPTLSSKNKQVIKEDIINQINYVFENISPREKEKIREMIISNNGSILDFKTMNYEALKYFIKKSVKELEYLKQIVFETRIDNYSDFTKMNDLVELKNKIKPEIEYEIAIGFEIFDDYLRNNYYKKGIDKKILEENLKKLSNLDINLRIYMMYKAVPDKFMDTDKAVEDINNAAEYFSNLSEKYNINIILHITPTYLSKGTKLYKDYEKGLYIPVNLKDIKKLFNGLKIFPNIKYYISLNTEGLGNDYFSKEEYKEFLEIKREIEKFNITNKKSYF
jgi:radical SAM enzyme (TIGR01210 family)